MIYFLLPNVNHSIYKFIDCIFTETIDQHNIVNSLAYYLYEIKNKIKLYEKEWDNYKKITNPYEFINTTIPGRNKCISKYKPLSRSYFKMIELLQYFMYDELFYNTEKIQSFHLAEGPGGFIEAISNLRNNFNDSYIGMTILHDNFIEHSHTNCKNQDKKCNKTVPGWKKSEYFLKTHSNVYIENGADKTGNILSLDNFLYCRSKYGSSMELVTGDGGFDFSTDFNNQEGNISQLLFAQVCYALCLQKHGGSFILKIFDCFMEHTVDILFILSAFYKNVYITKPKTSRYANSEKYIVCKKFILLNDSSIFPYLKMAFQKMMLTPKQFIHRFLKFKIPSYFIYKIDEYNAIFGQQQIENIYQTIVLIEQKQSHSHKNILDDFTKKNGIKNTKYFSKTDDNIAVEHNVDQDYQAKPVRIGLQAMFAEDTDTSSVSFSDIQLAEDTESTTTLPFQTSIETNIQPSKNPNSINMTQKKTYCNTTTDFSEKIENLIRINIRKCVQWCNFHNISHNFIEDADKFTS